MDQAVLGTCSVLQVMLFQRGPMCPDFSSMCHLEKALPVCCRVQRRRGRQWHGTETRDVCRGKGQEGTGPRGL